MRNTPPKLALRFFRWFCHPDYVEDIEGDLLERFESNTQEYGTQKARQKMNWEVLRLFRPGIIKPLSQNNSIIHPAMIRHNLLISFRSFQRDKGSFLINLIGLSTGLACAFFIYLWVQDEYQIDAFHEKGDELHQALINHTFSSGVIQTWEQCPALLGPALEESLPEIQGYVMYSTQEESPEGIWVHKEKHLVASGLFASEQFFQLFSFPLIEGDKSKVLEGKKNIVISRELANKFFGAPQKAMGKALEWENAAMGGPYTITGVFEDLSAHSTQRFDFVIPLAVFLDANAWAQQWNGSSVKTYVRIPQGVSLTQLNEKLIPFFTQRSGPEFAENNQLFFQTYSSRYLHNRYEEGKLSGGRITYVRLFSAIGFFILLIASINFMNLSTAKASNRIKQIGVKKTLGAPRKALIGQFLGESLLYSLLSAVAALLLVAVFLPQVNLITGKDLGLELDGNRLRAIAIIVAVTGLLAGSYPALFLSGIKPISLFKGNSYFTHGGYSIRKSLVVLQFTLSLLFIVGVLVINRQMEFTMNKNLGYDRDNVLYFQRHRLSSYDLDVFLHQIRSIPGVLNATNLHGGSVVNNQNKGSGFSWSGEPREEKVSFLRPQIGYDFFETLGLEILEGRTFLKEYGDESDKLIVNEAAAEIMGRENLIGKKIRDGDFEKEIVGICKNFHIQSLHEEMKPCVMRFSPTGYNVMVKVQSGREKATIDQLEKVYKEFHPAHAFEFSFLDEEYQKLYEAELKVASLAKYFSFLAIIISCLGLLGLATFAAEQRQKEIGIRKVLGANVAELVQMLSWDFTRMVLTAILVGIPISYLLAYYWLSGFAYKISLSPSFFLIASVAILLISWLTVGTQTLRAARVNPVECLKDE